jgi:hypothetical protein
MYVLSPPPVIPASNIQPLALAISTGVAEYVRSSFFLCFDVQFFYSISMVDITQAKSWTVVLIIAKQAASIYTSLQLIVDVKRFVNDLS